MEQILDDITKFLNEITAGITVDENKLIEKTFSIKLDDFTDEEQYVLKASYNEHLPLKTAEHTEYSELNEALRKLMIIATGAIKVGLNKDSSGNFMDDFFDLENQETRIKQLFKDKKDAPKGEARRGITSMIDAYGLVSAITQTAWAINNQGDDRITLVTLTNLVNRIAHFETGRAVNSSYEVKNKLLQMMIEKFGKERVLIEKSNLPNADYAIYYELDYGEKEPVYFTWHLQKDFFTKEEEFLSYQNHPLYTRMMGDKDDRFTVRTKDWVGHQATVEDRWKKFDHIGDINKMINSIRNKEASKEVREVIEVHESGGSYGDMEAEKSYESTTTIDELIEDIQETALSEEDIRQLIANSKVSQELNIRILKTRGCRPSFYVELQSGVVVQCRKEFKCPDYKSRWGRCYKNEEIGKNGAVIPLLEKEEAPVLTKDNEQEQNVEQSKAEPKQSAANTLEYVEANKERLMAAVLEASPEIKREIVRSLVISMPEEEMFDFAMEILNKFKPRRVGNDIGEDSSSIGGDGR